MAPKPLDVRAAGGAVAALYHPSVVLDSSA